MTRVRMVLLSAVVTVMLAAGVVPSAAADGDHRHVDSSFRATGFFHTAFVGHRWWLVTPDGRPFYSTGINHVGPTGNDTDRVSGICPYCEAMAANYPSVDAWTNTTIQRLHSWGINTIGTFSDRDVFGPRMPYTSLLSMAGTNDWFSPEFVARAESIAAGTVAAHRDDPNLIGWVTDTELRWAPDWRGAGELLDDYRKLAPGSPGRVVADRYVGDPRRFLRALAHRYFKVTTEAIHAQDHNHLILGVKQITQLTPPEVLKAARPYVDVFSVDDYQLNPGLDDAIHATWPMYLPHDANFSSIAAIVQRPVLVMEYSFRAADAGVPNSYPPIFPTLTDQTARANAFNAYSTRLYETPWVVGDHWFEYVDEPAGGRFDGEDSNFGLVSVGDVPWSTLVDRMTTVHAQAPDRLVDRRPVCWSWRRDAHGRVRCSDPGHRH
jgi:hypothetical protein